MLGDRARVKGDLGRAEDLLRAAVEAIALAGQSFVLVWALEALAAVVFALGQPRTAAVLLGTAHSTRESAAAHMRPILPPDEDLRRSLKRVLGAMAFDRSHSEGEQMSPTEALRLAPFDESDNSRPTRT
jgi:hypothetical protein